MKTIKECTVTFRNHGEITIPKGLRVVRMISPGREHYYLDVFPKELFPSNSIIFHDAMHYGLEIPVEYIGE